MVAGINALFGGGKHMGTFGPSFDERTYAKAKGLLKKSYDEFVAAGKSLAEFVNLWIAQVGDAIKVYLKRFITDLKEKKFDATEFSIPYEPRADGTPFGLLTPPGIGVGTHEALDRIVAEVGPLVEYVADRLNMPVEHVRSSSTFSSEQIDAVAMAIWKSVV